MYLTTEPLPIDFGRLLRLIDLAARIRAGGLGGLATELEDACWLIAGGKFKQAYTCTLCGEMAAAPVAVGTDDGHYAVAHPEAYIVGYNIQKVWAMPDGSPLDEACEFRQAMARVAAQYGPGPEAPPPGVHRTYVDLTPTQCEAALRSEKVVVDVHAWPPPGSEGVPHGV